MTLFFWILIVLGAIYAIGFVSTFVAILAMKDGTGPRITVPKVIAACMFSLIWPIFWF